MNTGLLERASQTVVTITTPRPPAAAAIVTLKPETWRVVRADGSMSDAMSLPAAVAEAERALAAAIVPADRS